jgi:hypothetical protein
MKLSPKVLFISSLVGLLSLGGLARFVSAKPSPVAILASRPTPSLIAGAREGDGETNDDTQSPAEENRLRSLAKITPEQARQSAEKAMGASASKVQIENEDSNLVYSVTIGKDEVKVDAGNGKVLYTDTPKNEHSEKSRPHSSIRVSEGPEGDGDGETNDDG